MQYSKPKNLVEFIVQMSSGALQTAFGKSAAKGWIGDPDTKPMVRERDNLASRVKVL